jgi:N-acetylglucosamine-6-phosphate deacetylase
MIAIGAQHIFDGEKFHGEGVVLIDGDRIAGILGEEPAGVLAEDLPEGAILAPGFVDLHVNGGGGVMFNDATDVEGLRRIAAAHAACGTTAILPTLISGTPAEIAAALAAVRAAEAAGVPGIVGLHLEGPFINPARRGIHPEAAVRPMTAADVAALTDGVPVGLALTVAPEMVEAALLQQLIAAGVLLFAGHTEATFEQAVAALDAGVAGFTHLYNAMSQLTARAPGAVGAALTDARATAGIIADGKHVHAAALHLALQRLGIGRLFLVSDAMATAGSAITEFTLHGRRITLADGRLTDAAGTLAGAHLTLAEAVRNVVAFTGIPWTDAVQMATSTPATVAGLTDRGRISVGARADLVVLDQALNVMEVWQAGARI